MKMISKRWPWLLCLLPFLLAVPAFASEEIYAWTDAEGVKHFTNRTPGDVTDYEVLPAKPIEKREAVVLRDEYLNMMQEVRQDLRISDIQRRQEAAARAERQRARLENARTAQITVEIMRLQNEISKLNRRAMSPYFTQGMRDAQIRELQDLIYSLEAMK